MASYCSGSNTSATISHPGPGRVQTVDPLTIYRRARAEAVFQLDLHINKLRHKVSLETLDEPFFDGKPYHQMSPIANGVAGDIDALFWREKWGLKAVKFCTKRTPCCSRFEYITFFLQEVYALQNVDHPCIIKLYEAVQGPGYMAMVLQYCSGKDLLSMYQQITEDNAHRYIRQICSAVHYLHTEKRIVHGDIHLNNIFVDRERRNTFLADFGHAQQLEPDSNMVDSWYGSKHFIAPEVSELPVDGTKMDVWSLGLVIFRLLTVRHVGTKIFNFAFNVNHLTSEFVEDELYLSLIKRMLDPNPATRADMDEVMYSLPPQNDDDDEDNGDEDDEGVYC